MKKLALIPTLLIATTPLVSLFSCNDKQSPYKVTTKEMENAIALVGVERIQTHFVEDAYDNNKSMFYKDIEFSPNISHSVQVWEQTGIYLETCVLKSGDIYWSYSRSSQTQENWDSSEATETNFETVYKLGVSLTEKYRGPVDAGQTYSFDNDKKCYTATYVKEGKTITISFYFLNKKLIKYDRVITSDVTGVQHEIVDFTYHNTTPQLPIPEYDQEVKLTYIPETLDDWECLVGPSGKIPALTYKVVADFSQWQGAKEDIFIFYITQNSGWVPYARTTFTIKAIMDNNGIGFSKADSYEEMSNKLRSYVPGNYTDCFINYDITQNPIVNFYVTVNAPIDENYRFTVYDEDYKPDYKN